MEKLNDELHKIFGNVNNWLHFAEAKNGVLIALASAIAIAVFQGMNELTEGPIVFYYAVSLEFFLLISLIVSSMSFAPQTKIKWLWQPGEPDDDDNLYFYGHIQKYERHAYLKKVAHALKIDTEENAIKLSLDLSDQIIINSFIASRKYNYFRIAAWIFIAGIVTPPIGLVLFYLIDPNH